MVILRETLIGLQYIHKLGIIHRDLKAANILVNNDGRVQLCDFGVSAQLSSHHGKRQTLVGTPWWMAPELISGTQYNYKADIWSLGITLLEMANGRPPLSNEDAGRALMLIPNQPPPRLEGGHWTSGLREIVAMCLNERPEDRPTAEELLKTKIMKAVKTPTSVLKELISRYEIWLRRGGNRVTLFNPMPGEEQLGEEPEEDENDGWDFEDMQKRLSFTRPYTSGNESLMPDSPPTVKPQRPGPSPLAGSKMPMASAPAGDHPLLRIFNQEPELKPPPLGGGPVSDPNFRMGARPPSPEGFKGITIPDLDDGTIQSNQFVGMKQIEIPSEEELSRPPPVQQPPPLANNLPERGPSQARTRLHRADSLGALVSTALAGSDNSNPPSPPRNQQQQNPSFNPIPSPRRFAMPQSAPASPPRAAAAPLNKSGLPSKHLPSKSASSMVSIREGQAHVPPIPILSDREAESRFPREVKPLNIPSAAANGKPAGQRPKDLNLKLPPQQGLNFDNMKAPLASPGRLPGPTPSTGPSSSLSPYFSYPPPHPPTSTYLTHSTQPSLPSWDLPPAEPLNTANLDYNAPKEALVGELERLLVGMMGSLEVMDVGVRALVSARVRKREEVVEEVESEEDLN